MTAALDPLPNDVAALRQLVLTQRAQLAASLIEIEQLKLLIAKLKRLQFGRSSEKLDRHLAQLELRLEELQTIQAAQPNIALAASAPGANRTQPVRRPLPTHLPREEVVHQPACACPQCGGAMKRIGEDVAEMLETCPRVSR